MGRAGRKRKGYRRERNGRGQRQSQDERVAEAVRIARAMPHRAGLSSNAKISELAESALGRLYLRGILTATERAAGDIYGGAVARYRATIEGPRPVRSGMPETAADYATESEAATVRFKCPAPGADPVASIVAIGPQRLVSRVWPCQLPGASCGCAERRGAYMRLHEAIARAGRPALVAVNRVAVRGEEPLAGELLPLKRGLRAAADFLRLDDDGAPRRRLQGR